MLRLARVITSNLDVRKPFHPGALRIIADLATAYGVPHEPEEFAAQGRTTFTDLVRGLVAELGDEPVDLVVLAHGMPDAEPNWPACYLSWRLPGEPLSFAVADNGVVTPFLALRIANVHDFRRAVVVVLEQKVMLRDTSLPAPVAPPRQNQMVALVFDRSGALGELSVEMTTDVDPSAAEIALRDAIVAPEGLPCTGPWLALADSHAQRVVLGAYDPLLRILGRCVIKPLV